MDRRTYQATAQMFHFLKAFQDEDQVNLASEGKEATFFRKVFYLSTGRQPTEQFWIQFNRLWKQERKHQTFNNIVATFPELTLQEQSGILALLSPELPVWIGKDNLSWILLGESPETLSNTNAYASWITYIWQLETQPIYQAIIKLADDWLSPFYSDIPTTVETPLLLPVGSRIKGIGNG